MKIVFVKQEFEHAVKFNSGLLTNMAIRFIKICGFYDPKTFKWWTIMKQIFKEKYIVSLLNKLSFFIISSINAVVFKIILNCDKYSNKKCIS